MVDAVTVQNKLNHSAPPKLVESPLSFFSLSLSFILPFLFFTLSPSQVVAESGSVNGRGKAQMDDTHMAAEEDEGEEGHIPRTQSPPVTHSLTHRLASDQLVKPVPELTSVAPRQHVCSPVASPDGSSASPTKPDNGAKLGANVTAGSVLDAKSASQSTTIAPELTRTIITKTPSDWFANGPRTPPLDDMPVPLKKIKVEEPWMWITEQAATQLCDDRADDDVCEDPLSTLAAVVCLSVTERKGLEEKLFSSRSSILRSIKTEPADLYFVKKEPEDLKSDLCQKSFPLGPDRTPQAVKEEPPAGVLQPSVQSLAEKRNLSFDQAIAIEALTQLAAIPQAAPRPAKSEDKCSDSSAVLASPSKPALQDAKSAAGAASTTAAQCNKVSVISSPRQQMSVIRPPVARQGSIIKCSQGSCSGAKTCHKPSRRTEHCFASAIIKSECSYNDPANHGEDPALLFGGAKGPVADKERNRDEEEVAAQLVDLAFIIQTRHNLKSENSPPRGTPVSAIKYNYKSQQLPLGQKKPAAKKAKTAAYKPRKKKADGQQEGLGSRNTPLKRAANGEMHHGGRGKKILQQGRAALPHKRSLFLPQTQIDLKRYLAEAQEVRRQLIHHGSAHAPNVAPCGPQHQSNSSATLHNGPLNQHLPCNGHSEYGKHPLSEVGLPGAEESGVPPGLGSELHGLANGLPRPPCSPPPSQQCYYKLEKSGSVTVLSTTTDADPGHSAESTPSKNSIGSFLDSPMSFLDTPTKNLLNTPSKKLADLPSCQCMGESMLYYPRAF